MGAAGQDMNPWTLRGTTVLGALALACLLALPARAQGVLLRIRPHVGDTLHARLEQQTEVSAVVAGPTGPTTKSVTTSVAINSRTIVQSALATTTLVLTVVDSAELHTSDTHGAAQVADAERRLRGQQLVLQLALDGTVETARDGRGNPVPRDMAEAMSAMPAIFPQHAVNVGDQWTREMPLPSGGPLGARGSGQVRATFRLDSLDRSGDIAFVSMRGDIVPDERSQGVELTGAVTGNLQLNRARGWMTESRFSVLVRSLITPPAATGLAPMRFVTRVTQRLRTMDKR